MGDVADIPDAVLFSGTVRLNLDPFNEHTDEELLDALARVNLGAQETPVPSRVPSSNRLAALASEQKALTPSINSSSGPRKPSITLSTEVSSGGSNFSQGQRQLVAMARALLRRSNLIIMDEATASVDFATDEAIQQAIRKEFVGSTLITIAHRLSSVVDYDRLLVLSEGKVAEFDTPIVSSSWCYEGRHRSDIAESAEKRGIFVQEPLRKVGQVSRIV